MKTYKITLEFAVDIYAMGGEAIPSKEEMQKRINKQMQSYNDGRYPFSVELINNGLENIINRYLHGFSTTSDYQSVRSKVMAFAEHCCSEDGGHE